MLKATALSLLLGTALIAAATPANAGWRHPGYHPHARFAFHHNFHHFNARERALWSGGHWRHTRWHGRFGWWWTVGGAWYFYDAPVYPYPVDVSTTYYDEDEDNDAGAGPQDEGGGPGSVWYHCSSPDGYYPYVKDCRSGWQQVPATPNDMQSGPQGEPGDANGAPRSMGPGPQGGPEDQDEGDDDQGPPPPPSH